MIYKKKLIIANIGISLLLFYLIAYFEYFPLIVNAKITNILLFTIVFILASLLIYSSLITRTKSDAYLFLIQSSLFVFIARAVPNIRLPYPPLHDPYFHIVCTLNILRYHTLASCLGDWFDAGFQLPWPDLHLLTATLVNITNIGVMQYLKFQEPAIGVVFFLAMYLLAKILTNNDKIAMLSAFLASSNDILIFYQSEYHPQGIAILYLVLIMYSFFKYKSINDQSFLYISAISIIAFIFSHYFTPLYLALIFISYLLMLWLINLVSYLGIYKIENHEGFKFDYQFYTIFIFLTLLYQLVFHIRFIYSLTKISTLNGSPIDSIIFYSLWAFVSILIICVFLYFRSRIVLIIYHVGCRFRAIFINYIQLFIHFTALFFILGIVGYIALMINSINDGSFVFLTSLLRASKYILFLFAVISIIDILKTKNINDFRLAIIFFCIFFSGALGQALISGFPTDRIILFLTPLMAIFASITLSRLWPGQPKYKKIIFSVLVASTVITTGFFNSQIPSYFFKDSGVNTDYWYSNDLSSMGRYEVTGKWIATNIDYHSKYITEFDTIVIPFFYAERIFTNIRQYLFLDYLIKNDANKFIIINPMINYSFVGQYFDKKEYILSINTLYCNGVLSIGVKEYDRT